jgi:hypothetical protein
MKFVKQALKSLAVFVVLFFVICSVAFAAIPFGITALVTAGKTKIYDISTQDVVIWYPSSITVSAPAAQTTFQVYIDQNINNLDNNTTVTLTPSTTGGTILRNLNVYVRVVVLDSNGQSNASPGNKKAVTGGTTDTNKVAASWTAITGAVSYDVYVGNEPGNEAFYGNTTLTSLDITSLPNDDPKGVPVTPLYILTVPAGGTISVPIGTLTIHERIQVFAVTSATTNAIINIPVEEVAVP